MIYWIVLSFFLIVWEFKSKTQYLWRGFNKLDKFILNLLYRGYADEGILNNGSLYLKIRKLPKIAITKYKEKGNIGIYLFLPFDKINKEQKTLIEKELKRKHLTFYIMETSNAGFVIDFKRDVIEIKNFLKFFSKEVFKNNEFIYLSSFKNICINPNKLIDFDDAMELEEKGIDIKIPITDGQWLLWKLRNWGKKI